MCAFIFGMRAVQLIPHLALLGAVLRATRASSSNGKGGPAAAVAAMVVAAQARWDEKN